MLGNGLACVKRPPQLRDDALQMMIGRLARGRYEKADAGDAGGAGASHVRRALDRHPADREHRDARR